MVLSTFLFFLFSYSNFKISKVLTWAFPNRHGHVDTFNTHLTKTYLEAAQIIWWSTTYRTNSTSLLVLENPTLHLFASLPLSFFPQHPLLMPPISSCSLFVVGRQAGRVDRSSYRQGGNSCPLKWNWGPVELSGAWLAWSLEGRRWEEAG